MTFCTVKISRQQKKTKITHAKTKSTTHLIEEIRVHIRHPLITPPPVHEQQFSQEPKLAKRVIRAHSRLRALQTKQPTSDIGLLDHGDVVGSVSNGERHGVSAVFDLQKGNIMSVSMESNQAGNPPT
jgi:hypothetical protein